MSNKTKYLFDSSVIISHLRKKAPLPEKLSKEGFAISSIVLAELLYGFEKNRSRKGRSELDFLMSTFQVDILSVDQLVAEIFTKDKVVLENRGRKIADFDLLIAATAKAHDLTLFTYNKKHFGRIPGLKLY